MVSTLLEADVGPFEVLNVRQVLELCLKSEVTLKVYFKQTVAMTIMKVYFRWAKCDHCQTEHQLPLVSKFIVIFDFFIVVRNIFFHP